jgi:hypothetical protein
LRAGSAGGPVDGLVGVAVCESVSRWVVVGDPVGDPVGGGGSGLVG